MSVVNGEAGGNPGRHCSVGFRSIQTGRQEGHMAQQSDVLSRLGCLGAWRAWDLKHIKQLGAIHQGLGALRKE